MSILGYIDALEQTWISNGYSRGYLDSFDALWQSIIASTHFSALDYAILYQIFIKVKEMNDALWLIK